MYLKSVSYILAAGHIVGLNM